MGQGLAQGGTSERDDNYSNDDFESMSASKSTNLQTQGKVNKKVFVGAEPSSGKRPGQPSIGGASNKFSNYSPIKESDEGAGDGKSDSKTTSKKQSPSGGLSSSKKSAGGAVNEVDEEDSEDISDTDEETAA